jgi:hypothetical protein
MRLKYSDSRGVCIDEDIHIGDYVTILVGDDRHPQEDCVIVEFLSDNKAKVRMPDGNILPFNKDRIRMTNS